MHGRERDPQVRGLAGTLVLVGALGGDLIWRPLTYLAAAIGAGLTYSAVTDACGLALALGKLPYNRGGACDMREVVTRLANGTA